MVTKKNEVGNYRYVPRQPMTEEEYKEKLEAAVLLMMQVCIPDEVKRAREAADRRWGRGSDRNG